MPNLALAGPQGVGQKCGKHADCSVGLRCGASWKCIDPSKSLMLGKGRQPGQCRSLPNCKKRGDCSFVKGRGCAPGSSKDCEQSEACLKSGRCGFFPKAIGCQPTPLGCRKSAKCKSAGNCSVIKGKHFSDCAPASDEECKASAECRTKGRCKFAVFEVKPGDVMHLCSKR